MKKQTKDLSEFIPKALVLAFEITDYMIHYMWKHTMKLPRKKKKRKRKEILKKFDKLGEDFLNKLAV